MHVCVRECVCVSVCGFPDKLLPDLRFPMIFMRFDWKSLLTNLPTLSLLFPLFRLSFLTFPLLSFFAASRVKSKLNRNLNGEYSHTVASGRRAANRMQYLSYALQTSTRLLSSHSQSQSQSQCQQEQEEQQLLAHACCSRGAQLLRLRQQELAKRRALELEDQLNANAISCDDSEESSETEQPEKQQQTEQGAVGGAGGAGVATGAASAEPAQ